MVRKEPSSSFPDVYSTAPTDTSSPTGILGRSLSVVGKEVLYFYTLGRLRPLSKPVV